MSNPPDSVTHSRLPGALLATLLLGTATGSQAITIDFDYTYDTSSFFGASQKTILNAAGSFFEKRISDSLLAIESSGANQFNAMISNPSGLGTETIHGFSVAADTLTVFVGGQDLGGSTLGSGGPGGYSVSGSSAFLDTAVNRGQGVTQGTGATDFGPWGGSITFNDTSSWYFDSDPSTSESFSGNDFYSVALHELAHLLGFGTADSWRNQIAGVGSLFFTGAESVALYGDDVPLSNKAHWAEGLQSTIDGAGSQEVAMDPNLTTGSRKLFTDLDLAALKDIGWEVTPVPLPAAVWLFGSGLLGLAGFARRRAA